MSFQYIFFDTYIGDVLRPVPVALVAGAVYFAIRRKRTPEEPPARALLATLFVAYLVAVLSITLFDSLVRDLYYWLIYHRSSGIDYDWFAMTYSFRLDFFRHFRMENLANILLFLPFGILYPLFRRDADWKRTLCAGLLTTLSIELIQPIVGRSFDINDIVLNGIAVAVSTGICCLVRPKCRQSPPKTER